MAPTTPSIQQHGDLGAIGIVKADPTIESHHAPTGLAGQPAVREGVVLVIGPRQYQEDVDVNWRDSRHSRFRVFVEARPGLSS
jgi:hypothetical protein